GTWTVAVRKQTSGAGPLDFPRARHRIPPAAWEQGPQAAPSDVNLGEERLHATTHEVARRSRMANTAVRRGRTVRTEQRERDLIGRVQRSSERHAGQARAVHPDERSLEPH